MLKDGKLFGRGASDMKGADAAFAVAAAEYLRERGTDFAGELWFAGVVQEECFEGVCAKEVARRVQPDRKSTRLNSSHASKSRMPSSA